MILDFRRFLVNFAPFFTPNGRPMRRSVAVRVSVWIESYTYFFMNKKLILSFVLALFGWAGASAQQFAVKTNLLYWMTTTPNVGVEVAVGQHSTLGATINCNPWTLGSDNKIQHWFVRPEYRYWVTEKYTRLFFGVHLMGGGFEVGGFKLPFIGDKLFKGLRDNYYKGSFVAGGVSIGYQFYVSPHWNLELSAGAGLARIKYHTEPVKGPGHASYQNSVRYLPVPTEVGVTFVYLFNSKK